jgi:hypothetical protein
LYWNVAMWIPTALAPGILVLMITAVDIFLMVQMAIATALQNRYIPAGFLACNAAATYQQPENGDPSFFELAAGLRDSPSSATDVCRDFVREWQLGLGNVYADFRIENSLRISRGFTGLQCGAGSFTYLLCLPVPSSR